jgi:hypothetical protein
MLVPFRVLAKSDSCMAEWRLLARRRAMTLLRRTTVIIALGGFGALACGKIEDTELLAGGDIEAGAPLDIDGGGKGDGREKGWTPPSCGELGPQPFSQSGPCKRGEYLYKTTGYHGSCLVGCAKTSCGNRDGECWETSCPSGRTPADGGLECNGYAGGPVCCLPITDAGVDASPDP